MLKVVFLSSFLGEVSEAMLGHALPGYEVATYSTYISDEEKAERVRDADFILMLEGRLPGAVMEAAPRLRLVQLATAGYDTVDLKAAARLGIPVSNMGVVIAATVAEHTVAMMLGVLRRLAYVDHLVKQGSWRDEETGCMGVPELAESTVGIVGLGNIGQTVAKRLQGFENRLLYADVVAYPDPEKALGIRRVPLDELLGESDVVTIHVPLTPSTRSMIGEREFSLMRPGAILVNTSRGPVVNEAALIRALEDGRIRGAGLDVFEEEPLAEESPLRRMKNVLLSPHIAGNSGVTWHRRGKFAFDNFQRVMRGEEPLSLVHPD
jgi:phosphoglycerate dehydrogenase-like enzyme